MNASKKFRYVLILGLLSAIGPFSIDLYLPAFPMISENLHTSVSKVMFSLSSFFIGVSAGQLLYGPLLERYGRKRPLYLGLGLYLVASAGCAFAAQVDALIAFRFLQALGGCVGMVAARAMVRDLFSVEENAKVFSSLMLVIAVSPIVAPTLGGYISHAWGWRAIFLVLMGLILIILAAVHFFLPNSKKPDPSVSFKPPAILKAFASVLVQPSFHVYALSGAVAYAAIYAYITGSPHVFMDHYGVSDKTYGWIFAVIATGLIVSGQINSLLLNRFKGMRIVTVAMSAQVIIGIILTGLMLWGDVSVYFVILLVMLFASCQGFIFPNTSAMAMASFPHQAGNASALMGFIQMTLGAASSALVGMFHEGAAVAMTSVMTGCSLLAFLIFQLRGKWIPPETPILLVEEEDAEMVSTL